MRNYKLTYPTQHTVDDVNYPYGKARNVLSSGDGSGTPLEQAWVNDVWGFHQALLAAAAITPSNESERVGASQLLTAIQTLIHDLPLVDTDLLALINATPLLPTTVSAATVEAAGPYVLTRSDTYVTGTINADCSVRLPAGGGTIHHVRVAYSGDGVADVTFYSPGLPGAISISRSNGPTVVEFYWTGSTWSEISNAAYRNARTVTVEAFEASSADVTAIDGVTYARAFCDFDVESTGPENGTIGAFPNGAVQFDIGSPTGLTDGETFELILRRCILHSDWLLSVDSNGSNKWATNGAGQGVVGYDRDGSGWGGNGFTLRFVVVNGAWRHSVQV